MKVRHEASPLLTAPEIEPIQVSEGNRLIIEQAIDYPSDLDLNPVRALLLRAGEFIPEVTNTRLKAGRLGVRLFDYRAKRNITPEKQQRMQRQLRKVFEEETPTTEETRATTVQGIGFSFERGDLLSATVNCQLLNTGYLQHEQFLISSRFYRFGMTLPLAGPEEVHLLPLGQIQFAQAPDVAELERFRQNLTQEAPVVVSFDSLVE